MQAKSQRSKLFASGHWPVASVRHFLRHFASFLDMQASKGEREGGQEIHVRFPSKLSEEMRRMCGGLPAYHTVFSICNAPRVEFSAGVLMLTNYCQLLYLIPRLSLSPLSSSPFPPSQQAPARRSRKMSHPCLDHRRQTSVNDETYPLRVIFYS